ncbi:recombinase family protein, partial [Streptomyces scopuliridis]
VLDSVAEAGGRIVSVRDGLDSSVSGQRIVFAVVSEQARSESENISTRVRSARAEARRLGKWPAGSPPYGTIVAPDKTILPDTETTAAFVVLNGPSKADVARHIHMELQQDKSARKVALALNEAGIPAPAGGAWSSSSVTRIAYAPAVAGLLPERVKKSDGTFTGATRVYIDPETGHHVMCGVGPVTPAERLRTLAAMSSRVTKGADGKPRGKRTSTRHVLTDLAVCPGCLRNMARSWQNYICASRDGGMPCPNPSSIQARYAEGEVRRRWIAKLTASEPDDPFLHAVAEMWIRQHKPEEIAKREAVEDEIKETEKNLVDLEDGRYVRKEFTTAAAIIRYEKLHERLESRLGGLRSDLADLPAPKADIAPLLDPELVEATWDAAGDHERRALLRLAIVKISVDRAPGKGQLGDLTKRIKIKWIDDEAAPFPVGAAPSPPRD